METILDIFNGDAFHATSMTETINIVPNSYGRVQQMGLFQDRPSPTKTVAIGIENGVLNLIPSRPRTAAPSYGAPATRKTQNFSIPYFPHDDAVYATEVQDLIQWGGGSISARQLSSVTTEVNRKLLMIRNKHAITLEWLRMTALAGKMLDADATVLIDYFAAFGITQKTVDFALGTSGTDIIDKCRQVNGYMEDNLLGETMTSTYCFASPTFMSKMLARQDVKDSFKYFQDPDGINPNKKDYRKGFPFGDVYFQEYRATASYLNEDGTTTIRRMIADGEAIFVPLGTLDTFVNYWGPPNFMDLVNNPPDVAQPVFVAPLERMKFGAGVEMHTESSPLPMVKRPALLVRGTSST